MDKPIDYKQYDSKWASSNYSAKGESKTIKSSGCGVTCSAMVIASLKDKSVTPVVTANWSMAHGYKALNQGTYYTYFVPQFKEYGITCKQLNQSNLYGKSSSSVHTEAKNELKKGNWIIACMGKGNWTSAGHFILLYKIDDSDYVYINDPASTASGRLKNTWSLFSKQVKYMWSINVPDSSTKGSDKMLTISDEGINLIKSFEGYRNKSYQDAVGVWTIGYGTTKINGKKVTSGMTCTEAQAVSWLKADCEKFVSNVNKYDSKYHWTQKQLDALTSFAYNVGSIDMLTANGTRTIAQISEKILAYNKAGGKVLAGLTTRRQKEKALFDGGSVSVTKPVVSGSATSTYTKTQFIKDVQLAIEVVSDGIVGQKTLAALVTVSKTKNSKHKVVLPLQKYLNALKYDCGTLDCIFGSKLATSVAQYQKKMGLTADGVVGVNTWKKLLL